MGYATCRACNGSGRYWPKNGNKSYDCRACGGSGSNKNLWTTRCQRCPAEIVYKAGTTTPRFCKDCRNIQLEKNCWQTGCTNTIRYKVSWENVPNYCKRCETKRQQGFTPSTCSGTGIWGCGKLIWSPPGKNFRHCQECSEKDRAAKAAEWLTKSCIGWDKKGCSNTIKYHKDWKNPPNLCPSCKEKSQSMWDDKSCDGCGGAFKYRKDWDHPPRFCKVCKPKADAVKGKRELGANDSLPGSRRTPADLGCTHATVSGPNKFGGQHVTVYSRHLGYHEHYSYDTDIHGNYKPGTAHYTDRMAEVLRKHGHDRT